MHSRLHKKMIHEGKYIAEVEVELINPADNDCSPYISVDDALKLDTVRIALRNEDMKTAKQFAKVYFLSEVAT